MKPSSYCTISTDGSMRDLLALINSMSLHMSNSKLYILADTVTKEYIENDFFPKRIEIYWNLTLDKYTNKRRPDMEKEGIWSDFQLEKTNALLWAFEMGERDVMFLDADLFFLKELDIVNYTGEEVVLSPHYIVKKDEDKFGKYNGGVFWTNNSETIDTWRDHFKTSRYYDQACLEDVARLHSYCEMNEGQNMSWWRIFQGNEHPQDLINKFSLNNGILEYDNHPVDFIHTHLYDKTSTTGLFNKIMLQILSNMTDIRNFLLVNRFINGGWNIFIPKQPMPGVWNHTNDSFRELTIEWDKKGLVKTNHIEQIGNCWFGTPGMCLLYDRDTIDWLNRDPLTKQAKISLFANPSPPNGRFNYPWIYWARRPVMLEENKTKFRSNKKTNNVVFIGNIENNVQGAYRSDKWESVVDDFHLTRGPGTNLKFSHMEYLNRISQAKFGLCLRGYGQKCHRETELMGVGTIPLVTNDCDMSSYTNPPIENIHYLKISNPDDISHILNTITSDKIKDMSEKCIEWWETNCSVTGSFRVTLDQIFHQ